MDKWSYRTIVATICSCVVVLIVGGLNIASRTGDIPVQIGAIILAALAYLGGLLTPTPNKNSPN